MRRALTVLAALCAAASLVSAAPAGADVSGPDESTASAYGPIRSGSTIPGQLQDSSDVDYIAFDVIAAGQAVHFDVTNEVHGCSDPSGSGCPIWATLMTASDQQVGGDSSSAGTGAMTEYYPTDTIDWTFTQPGRYYLLIESGGYPVPYSVSFTETPPPNSTRARPYFSLSLSSHQRGPAVRVRFRARTPLRSASFRLLLHGRALGTLRLASPPVGAPDGAGAPEPQGTHPARSPPQALVASAGHSVPSRRTRAAAADDAHGASRLRVTSSR